MKQNVCRYNKYGYCKFCDKCKFKHNNVKCVDENCDVFNCEKRHPVACKYFRNFQKCRFPNCAFNHDIDTNEKKLDEKLKRLENKVKENDQKTCEKKFEIKLEEVKKKFEKDAQVKKKDFENTLEALEKDFENRLGVLEKQLKRMVNCMNEKDLLINTLNTKVEEIEKKQDKQQKETNNMKTKIEKLKVATKKEEIIKCPDCDFIASSKQGLKVHMKRKHTCKTENNPEKCDVCEEKFLRYSGEPWEKEMIESHILSHAYKGEHELKFKCDECEFWGPNKLTMEVHVRKVHCENISCRLCDFKASSKNDLETHLSTCER